MMKANVIFVMLTLCYFYAVFGEAQHENRSGVSSEFKIDIHNLPRINGVINISELKEVLLVSAEKTQLTGRFGIVVARIEDLVKIPDFISFKPVVVIGKLNYKRNGTSYECYIQWEKVCLLTPAFNKVKVLPKVLVSKFILSNVEIPTEFHMKAVGDIPNFVQSVRELFSAPVATTADFTDKEKEKIADFQKNTLSGDLKPKREGTSENKDLSKLDGSRKLDSKSSNDPKDNKEGDRNTSGQAGKNTSPSSRNPAGGTEDKRKEDAASRNGDSTSGSGVSDTNGTTNPNGAAGQEDKPDTLPKTPGADGHFGQEGKDRESAAQVRVPADGRSGDSTVRTGANGANGTGATNGQAGQNGRQGTNPSGGDSSAEDGRDGRDGTGAPQVRVPADGRSGDSTVRTGANGANGTGATNGQAGQNGRQEINFSRVGSSAESGRDGRDVTGAPQVRIPGDGRAGDPTAQTGANSANGTGSTNGQAGQNGRSRTNTTTFGAAGWGGRDGNEGSGAPQVGAPSDGHHSSSAHRAGANSAGNAAHNPSFNGSGYNDGNDTSTGGYTYDRELNNTTTYLGARSTSNQARASYNVPEMQLPRVTRIGCTPREDISQLRVYEQEKLITMEGGREVHHPCKDSSTFYTIYKDYNCYPYRYDFRQNRAIAQFAYVYTDGNSHRKVIIHQGSDTHLDPKRYIIFQETAEGCTPNKKYTDNDVLYEMAKCTKKFFVKPSGETEFVTPRCEETNTRARVRTTRDGCDIIHNFGEGKSYYQSRKVYQFPGDRKLTEYEACKPEPTAIPHIPVKCNPDIENGKIFERVQIEIDTNTGRKVIRPCQRVAVDGVPLKKEFRGYYLTGTDFNYPYIRKYYMHNDTKNYLDGDEVDFSKRYPSIPKTIAYHNEDDKLHSTPILQYTFKNSEEKTVVGLSNVRGAPMKYKDTNVTVIKDVASPEIVGCTKTTKRANYRIWKRQDGTEYFEKREDVNPLVEHVCQTEYVPKIVTLKTILRYKDAKYETVDHDGHCTHGSNEMFYVEAAGEKTLEEMKALARRRYPLGRLDGTMTGLTLMYIKEEKTYCLTKRDGQIIGEPYILSTKTYDETVN